MLCGHPVPAPRWALTCCSSMLGRELPLSMRLLWPFCRGRGTSGPQLKAGLPIHPMGLGWAAPAPSSGLPLPSLRVLGRRQCGRPQCCSPPPSGCLLTCRPARQKGEGGRAMIGEEQKDSRAQSGWGICLCSKPARDRSFSHLDCLSHCCQFQTRSTAARERE